MKLKRKIELEEQYLNNLIAQKQEDKELYEWAVERAKHYVEYAELLKEDKFYQVAEHFIDLAREIRKNSITVKDIREQRERVQWHRRLKRRLSSDSSDS